MLWDSFDDGSSTVDEVEYGVSLEGLKNCAQRTEYGYYMDGRFFDEDGKYCHQNVAELNHDSVEELYVQEAQALTAEENTAHYIRGTFSNQPLCYAPEDEVIFFIPVGEEDWAGLMTETYDDLVPMDKEELPEPDAWEKVICGLKNEEGDKFILINDKYSNVKWHRA